MAAFHIDSFSGAIVDIPKRSRDPLTVLRVLDKHPRVSTWDMSEYAWVRGTITDLKRCDWIAEQTEPYPWHRYAITAAGKAVLHGGQIASHTARPNEHRSTALSLSGDKDA